MNTVANSRTLITLSVDTGLFIYMSKRDGEMSASSLVQLFLHKRAAQWAFPSFRIMRSEHLESPNELGRGFSATAEANPVSRIIRFQVSK